MDYQDRFRGYTSDFKDESLLTMGRATANPGDEQYPWEAREVKVS